MKILNKIFFLTLSTVVISTSFAMAQDTTNGIAAAKKFCQNLPGDGNYSAPYVQRECLVTLKKYVSLQKEAVDFCFSNLRGDGNYSYAHWAVRCIESVGNLVFDVDDLRYCSQVSSSGNWSASSERMNCLVDVAGGKP